MNCDLSTYSALYAQEPAGDYLMANGRHSFVAFYPSDWLAGTMRMDRLHRSVYFDICCYTWDTAKPVPALELAFMIADVPNGQEVVSNLIAMEKVERLDDGSVVNAKALVEAEKAFGAWRKMSEGGKGARKGASKGDGNGDEEDASSGMGENQNQNQNQKEDKSSCASDDALKPEHVVDKWNETALHLGKPRVRDLTPERRQLVKARIAQYSIEDFIVVFEKIKASAFLRGDKNWKGATFDWTMKKANFQKIIEGNYDE